MTAAPTQNPVAQNMANRAALLQQGVPMVRKLGTFGKYQPGDTALITLDRMGVFTRLAVSLYCTIDVTVAATISPFGLYALISNIAYIDFNNFQRVRTSGPQLAMVNSSRLGRIYTGVVAQGQQSGVGIVDTNIYSAPTAVSNVTAYFQVDVPLAYHEGMDLRGAILAQTVVGQHQLSLTFGSTAVGDEYGSVYTAGTVAISDIQFDIHEYYIQPANLNQLPQIDLSTVYANIGNWQDDSNISSNSPKYVNYPNNQSVVCSYHYFQNGGAGTANQTDVTSVQVIANSSTILKDYAPSRLRAAMRNSLGGADLPSGNYIIESRSNPILTSLYGNVQAKFNLGTVTAGTTAAPTRFVSHYESFFPAGSPLPGVASGY